MDESTAHIRVQVCFARPDAQLLRDLKVPVGTTLQEAIQESGVVQDAGELDMAACRVGIYGKLKTPDTVLRDLDRVEIYRPLIADPMESRRKRAEKKEHTKIR
jgi:putative ubiquitin-RnfH superfamily antitoxin RatB of RatAB toxin-antitoxin module